MGTNAALRHSPLISLDKGDAASYLLAGWHDQCSWQASSSSTARRPARYRLRYCQRLDPEAKANSTASGSERVLRCTEAVSLR